ncbi:hypothetical protein SHKM778_08020 [Streptomyces sp. KM77-8]|uniref:SMI1/KNR4 family protein n=1 Tax=Streptomyces haneummycinicus TaxID=3074435 RepID=A0AAT9HAK4_9ACTN
MLPISHWGCGMYACVDCRSPRATVLLFEPNPGDPDNAWFLDAPALTDWLHSWVQGTGWYEEENEGMDLPPGPASPAARHRSEPPDHAGRPQSTRRRPRTPPAAGPPHTHPPGRVSVEQDTPGHPMTAGTSPTALRQGHHTRPSGHRTSKNLGRR